ncbi:MAG: hypothetical protein O3A06_09950 [Proteobacteria bacterium]|nr:hypothetical protein [Pseudomonadota bacterium]
MKEIVWLLIIALVSGIAGGGWYALRRYRERQATRLMARDPDGAFAAPAKAAVDAQKRKLAKH